LTVTAPEIDRHQRCGHPLITRRGSSDVAFTRKRLFELPRSCYRAVSVTKSRLLFDQRNHWLSAAKT
jgi:hypothetical protein